MKYLAYIIISFCPFILNAQVFTGGHSQVEYDNPFNPPGISIQNKSNSPLGSSVLAVYNNLNHRIDLGMRSSGYLGGANRGYISVWNKRPLDFFVGGEQRMSLDSLGRICVIGDDLLTDTIMRIKTDLSGKYDVHGLYVECIPDGENSNWGAGASFKGGWRGVRGFSKVGVGVEGSSQSNDGVFGSSTSGNGVFGFSINDAGVYGSSLDSAGVLGVSTNNIGVAGISNASVGAGVYGYNSQFGNAIWGNAEGGTGVVATSENGHAMIAASKKGLGLRVTSDSLYGIESFGRKIALKATSVDNSEPTISASGGKHGIFARGSDSGVYGESVNGHGVTAFSGGGLTQTAYDFYAAGPAMDMGSYSSRRWKSNVKNIEDPLEKISRLRGVRFDWDEEHGGNRHDIGFIAEEVGEVLPEIVSYEENGVDADAMDYTKVPALIVEAFNVFRKQYESKIQELESKIEALEERL